MSVRRACIWGRDDFWGSPGAHGPLRSGVGKLSDLERITMGDKLLNTAEAARFLRVSQASVRRWSDSGSLEARRVGRRRERRFREADLTAFLSRGSSSPAPRPRTARNGVFVGGIHVALHSH